MLPRPESARQSPADPPVTDIGVGIDTSRYGHYAAFLDPDLRTAAPDLEVLESAAGYARLRRRIGDLVARHGRVRGRPSTARACGRTSPTGSSSCRWPGCSTAWA